MSLKHKPEPKIIRPFDDVILKDLQTHIRELRRCFDWPGIPYHDAEHAEADKFNRWFWHNLPLLKYLHSTPEFLKTASDLFGQPLRASYAFISMYGPEGVCPVHTDRPQCQFTIDLCVNSDGVWPIIVDEKEYVSKPGEALAYSGTGQVHYRKPMKETGVGCTYMDLAFFHFVPVNWQGKLD